MSKKILITILMLSLLIIVGCGNIKRIDDLYDEAVREHGECTIVSQTTTDRETILVLHDNLQDFDYMVTSKLSGQYVDGSYIRDSAHTTDTFYSELYNIIYKEHESDFNSICNKFNSTYKIMSNSVFIYTNDDELGQKAAIQIAEIIQDYNIKNRLDLDQIYVYNNNEFIGSIYLPNLVWVTVAEENVKYFTSQIENQIDKNAKYLRTEQKTFLETGARLENVVQTLGSSSPINENSLVNFYYFELNGKEYYMCDFNYYNKSRTIYNWYTNYNK